MWFRVEYNVNFDDDYFYYYFFSAVVWYYWRNCIIRIFIGFKVGVIRSYKSMVIGIFGLYNLFLDFIGWRRLFIFGCVWLFSFVLFCLWDIMLLFLLRRMLNGVGWKN